MLVDAFAADLIERRDDMVRPLLWSSIIHGPARGKSCGVSFFVLFHIKDSQEHEIGNNYPHRVKLFFVADVTQRRINGGRLAR